MVSLIISIITEPSLVNIDCTELTAGDTLAAADTGVGIDDVRLLLLAGDGLCGALTSAEATADALLFVDGVGQQIHALLGGALLVVDVSLVFVTEVTDGGQNRVGSSLAQAAQCAVLDRKSVV